MSNNAPKLYHNSSTEYLIDELGRFKAKLSDLENKTESIKNVLITRLGIAEVEGKLFRVTISSVSQWRLNADKVSRSVVRAGLATKENVARWIKKNSKKNEYLRLSVKARVQVKKAA